MFMRPEMDVEETKAGAGKENGRALEEQDIGDEHGSPSVRKLVKNIETMIRRSSEKDLLLKKKFSNQEVELGQDGQEYEYDDDEEEELKSTGSPLGTPSMDDEDGLFFDVDEENRHVVANLQEAKPKVVRKEFKWYDEDGTDSAQEIGFTPVVASDKVIRNMVEARDLLDDLINQGAKGTKTFPVTSYALEVCETVSELASLVHQEEKGNYFQMRLDPDHCNLVREGQQESKDVEEYLRNRGVRVNNGSRYRASNRKGIVHALISNIIYSDGSIFDLDKEVCPKETFENSVYDILLMQSCFVDELATSLLSNLVNRNDVEVVSGFGRYKEQTSEEEKDQILDRVIFPHYGDVRVTVGADAFLRTSDMDDGDDENVFWGTGIRFEGKGVIFIKEKSENGLQFRVEVKTSFDVTLDELKTNRGRLLNINGVIGIRRMTEDMQVAKETEEQQEQQEEQFMRRDLPRLAVQFGERYANQVQVYGWGKNESSVLGIGSNQMGFASNALPLPFWGVLECVRVSHVSCGWYHCAALTDMGLIYTWGSGGDGALGHGNTLDSEVPRLVDGLGSGEDPNLAIGVACGSDLAGSHTVCITRNGRVYSWGLGTALGLGDAENRLEPTELDQQDFNEEKIDLIACGGGFSLAVSCKGSVFTWGHFLHGRLGLGMPEARPEPNFFARRRARRGAQRMQMAMAQQQQQGQEQGQPTYLSNLPGRQRYRLRPKRVEGLLSDANVVDAACGEAHAVVVDAEGRVFSWGKGSHGQLGTGLLKNALVPKRVEYAISSFSNKDRLASIPMMKKVACGANHCLAIDREGRLFAWGGLGCAALGLGESMTNWAVKVKGSFVVSDKPSKSGNAYLDEIDVENDNHRRKEDGNYRPLEEEQPWRWPNLVDKFQNEHLKSISAGMRHSAAVTTEGNVYVWGQSGCRNGEVCAEPRMLKDRHILNQHAEMVSCGGWHTILSTSGSSVAHELVRNGLAKLNTSKGRQQLQPDLIVSIGNDVFYLHRAILAGRCPVLNRVLDLDAEPDEDQANVMRLALNDVSTETFQIVLEYLYGDNVFTRLDPLGMVAEDVERFAAQYELKRLQAIAARAQAISSNFDEENEEQDTDEEFLKNPLVTDQSLLESTFSKDMGSLVNDPTYADVVFNTNDGKKLHAHSVVLQCRCPYFANIFAKLRENGSSLDIDVEDSLSSMSRFLSYLYTGDVISDKDAELLEDMKIAHRHGLGDFVRKCESMIELSTKNVLHSLLVAKRVESPSLMHRAIHFIVLHLSELSQTKQFLKLQRDHTDVLILIQQYAHNSNCFQTIISESGVMTKGLDEDDPVRLLKIVMKSDQERERERLELENKQLFAQDPFPWKPILILLLCVLCYSYLMSDPTLLRFVPFANIVVIVGAMAWFTLNLGS